ncbi:MAG: hypothetical protein JXC85_05560 [Candidatus Aenigmarchaeota archaeon]|nr:hypothetical protein [Candidatus Aenigmarchaeota archaeon]
MPEGITCSMAISDSGRTTETGDILLPLLEEKSGNKVEVIIEPLLSKTRCEGGDSKMISNGRENMVLITKYAESGDYGFFIGHDGLIVATAIAIADDKSIELPQYLRLIEYEESHIEMVMDDQKVNREAAIKMMKEWCIEPVNTIPNMDEASALFFDFKNGRFEYILPSHE